MMKKRIAAKLTLFILPLMILAFTYYSLETYYNFTHNECGIGIQILSVVAFIISLIIWLTNRKNGKIYTALAVYAALMLFFTFWIGGKIPFCVECDQVTAEELGFLTHWIHPIR